RVVDELEQVAVAGDDVDRAVIGRRQGADDVVGLVLGGSDDGDAERAEHLADDRHLRLERVGDDLDVGAGRDLRGDAVGLVAWDEVDAPLRAPVVVPAGDELGGGEVGDEPGYRVEGSAHGV